MVNQGCLSARKNTLLNRLPSETKPLIWPFIEPFGKVKKIPKPRGMSRDGKVASEIRVMGKRHLTITQFDVEIFDCSGVGYEPASRSSVLERRLVWGGRTQPDVMVNELLYK